MRVLGILFLYLFASQLWGQEVSFIQGMVANENTQLPMETVHVLNLTQVIGTTSDGKGKFEIPAVVNDTLYFSYLGYKPLKIAVTSDMLKFKNTKFQLTELAYALEEVIIRPYQLTGYLDVDARNVPLNNNSRYQIIGLPNVGYEAGNRDRSAFSKALGALFNPADFLHNLFGKNPKQMRKLKKMRADDEIKNLLLTKFDRTVLEQLLGLERIDIDEILRNCNYSDVFIKESNDLQILEAISGCYEEYRVLQL
ncbi:MAG: carboxypeptidase-like regulatory domain-containing protein [Flavobacteriaceae bacterium]